MIWSWQLSATIDAVIMKATTEQQESMDVQGYDLEQAFGDDTLNRITQLQNEINQGVAELEREL
jgi:hypothetical protein